ncbi:MAG: hypothetical protein IK004_02125 [Bacteroidales bacterium]|nr:hypothetical protein [Bacteroidales bacterium]
MEDRIIVCWNKNGFEEELKKNPSFIVCTSFNEFKNLNKMLLKNTIGFVVLCELTWDDEKDNLTLLEFGGITFVQRYVRGKMSLKAPVVFTSINERDYIISKRRDATIIKTPALQHGFVKFNPTTIRKDLVRTLQNMQYLTNAELAYTKLLYCDIKGLLVQISHELGSRAKNEQDKYRKDIEYVIKEQFNNDSGLIEYLHNTDDLGDFCKKLITRLESSENLPEYGGFLNDIRHKTIRILLVDDKQEEDEYVGNFVNYIKNMGQKNKNPMFKITVINNIDIVDYDSIIDYDVIICDIEIRNDKDELITLGFNIIEKMAKISKRPLYYIVTNVSRSLYDQIKTPYVKRIRLKKEVFGTKQSIETFLYGIKEVFDSKSEDTAGNDSIGEAAFKKFDAFIRTDIYPINISFKSYLRSVESYDDLASIIVKDKTLELIKYFLTIFSENDFKQGIGEYEKFKIFDDNCKRMRDYIKDNFGYGNGKSIIKRINDNEELSSKDVSNFVVKIILRRFFLYVKSFVEHYDIMESFKAYKNSDIEIAEINKDRSLTVKDIACRAISDQFKKLLTSKGAHRSQEDMSHCLGETLLIKAEREPMLMNDEEKIFISIIKGNESFYSTNKKIIQGLKM